ncbi:MAG: hypothetical protein WCA23_22285 [Stellaceae bacterium]
MLLQCVQRRAQRQRRPLGPSPAGASPCRNARRRDRRGTEPSARADADATYLGLAAGAVEPVVRRDLRLYHLVFGYQLGIVLGGTGIDLFAGAHLLANSVAGDPTIAAAASLQIVIIGMLILVVQRIFRLRLVV